jgi:hypothetical protein
MLSRLNIASTTKRQAELEDKSKCFGMSRLGLNVGSEDFVGFITAFISLLFLEYFL